MPLLSAIANGVQVVAGSNPVAPTMDFIPANRG